MKATVRTYIAIVTIAGCATLVAFAILDIGELPIDEPAFWILAMLVVFGEMFPLLVPFHDEHEEVTTSTTFVFALLLMFGIASAVFAQVAASLIADRHRGVPWWKATFNLSQYTLAWLAAGLVLTVVAGDFTIADPSTFGAEQFFGIALAGLTFFVVNTELVGIALAMVTGVPILRHFRAELGFYISTAAVLLSLGLIVAIVADWRVEVIPLILAPLWIAYRSAKVSLEKEYQSRHDALTGLPNRLYFTDRVQHKISSAPEEPFAVMVLDLDRFKEVNDTLGHQIGDDLLRLVGTRLTETIGPDGLVARLGGDEFAVIAPGDTAAAVAQQLQRAFDLPFLVEGLHFDIDASIGSACYPDHGVSVDDLLKAADVAMYVAKEQRRGFAIYEAALDRNDARRLQLLGELRSAIERGEVIVYFQPEIATGNRVIVGAEALVRWEHPKLGLLSAAEFVPLAESTSLIGNLTDHVLRASLTECAAWRTAGYDLWVSVNISVRSLYEDGFVEGIARTLAECDVEPRLLMLEVTESMMVTDPARAAAVLARLHEIGVGIAVDDFGTGYSSLAYLKRLPVDLLKIDRSFVANVANDDDDLVIVRSTVDLAHSLGLQAVAEGVENQAAMNILSSLGCDLVQGYHLCQPMPAAELRAWLQARRHVPEGQRGNPPPDQLVISRW